MASMKLFIWTNVLTDYTSGMAVAIAETKEEAIKILDLGEYPSAELRAVEPQVIPFHPRPKAEGWYVYGGG